jgi:hypothetical protein
VKANRLLRRRSSDPNVVIRADHAAVPPGASREVRGARNCARRALSYSEGVRFAEPVLINGAAGIVVAPNGRLSGVLSFTVKGGKIIQIDVIDDPARLRKLDLAVLDD